MIRHVLFVAAGQTFALPLGEVREVVVPPATYTRVPRAPATVRGVLNLRGRIVTALDFARLLALEGPLARDPSLARLLLLEGKVRDLALIVDEVAGIQALGNLAAPAPGAASEIVGLARLAAGSATVLAADRLIESVRAALDATRTAKPAGA